MFVSYAAYMDVVLRSFFLRVSLTPPPFPLCVRALPCGFLSVLCVFFYPSPCRHARNHCTGHRVTAPLCVHLWSSHQHGACPLAVLRNARCRGGRPSLASPSTPPSLLPPPPPPFPLSPVSRPSLTAALLHGLRCAAPLRARAVSRAPSRVSPHAPCLLSCRQTWAASPGIPSG